MKVTNLLANLPYEILWKIFSFIYDIQIKTNPQRVIRFLANNAEYKLPTRLNQRHINYFLVAYQKARNSSESINQTNNYSNLHIYSSLRNIRQVNKHFRQLVNKYILYVLSEKPPNGLLNAILEFVLEEALNLCGYPLKDASEITKLPDEGLRDEIIIKLTNNKMLGVNINLNNTNVLDSISKSYDNKYKGSAQQTRWLIVLERMQRMPRENSKSKEEREKLPELSLEKLLSLYRILLSTVVIMTMHNCAPSIRLSYAYLDLIRKYIDIFVNTLNNYEKKFLLGQILDTKQPREKNTLPITLDKQPNTQEKMLLSSLFKLEPQAPTEGKPTISEGMKLLLFPQKTEDQKSTSKSRCCYL